MHRALRARLLRPKPTASRVTAWRGIGLMRLEVQPANRAAIARYKKSGYRHTGRLPGYYNDGSDALRYEKNLVAG